MLLHLGGDWAANSRRIIAILDYGTVTGSRGTKRMLQRAEKQGLLEHIDDEAETRSIVLVETARGTRLVLSPISATALRGRLNNNTILYDFAASPAASNRKGR